MVRNSFEITRADREAIKRYGVLGEGLSQFRQDVRALDAKHRPLILNAANRSEMERAYANAVEAAARQGLPEAYFDSFVSRLRQYRGAWIEQNCTGKWWSTAVVAVGFGTAGLGLLLLLSALSEE